MEKILNIKEKILGLDNKPLTYENEDLSLGKAIAIVLVSSQRSTDPLRSYVLGRKFMDAKEETMELNATDIQYIKEAIGTFQGFNVLVTGQILQKFL